MLFIRNAFNKSFFLHRCLFKLDVKCIKQFKRDSIAIKHNLLKIFIYYVNSKSIQGFILFIYFLHLYQTFFPTGDPKFAYNILLQWRNFARFVRSCHH